MTKAEKIEIAARYLSERGYVIAGRNVRPCRDPRCEIDILARTADSSGIIFVTVVNSCSKKRDAVATQFDRRKRNIMLRACTNWILKNRWHGNFRHDVLTIIGKGDSAEIVHIENNALFPPKWRFW